MNTLADPFTEMLKSLSALRKYVKIFYFSDLHELFSVTSLIKTYHEDAQGDSISLASGETIPVSRLVNVDGVYPPDKEDYAECLACRI
ncbi:hypothetical protein [Larkinella soli]|uniref:hypothetical protein n=1 Tax=Larkinella soli TaxID=1770527 RepID=UPI000FFC5B9B|nr:hypothetical protein [Larkinella soli]